MEKKNSKFRSLKTILVIVFTLLFVFYMYASYRAEYLQTLEIGEEYLGVFNQNIEYKLKLFGTSFVILFFVILFNNISIKKGLKIFFDDEKKQMPKLPNKSIAFVVAAIGSIVITYAFLDKFILLLNTTWFGITNPAFGIDIGFYFFQKPFISLLLNYISTILIGLLLYTTAYYIIVFNVLLEGIDRELLKQSKFVKTLKKYAFLIVVTFALKTLLNTFCIGTNEFMTLKDSISTRIIGAGITDISIKVWGYRLLCIAMIISSIFILKYFFKKDNTKKLLISACIVPGYLIALSIIMLLFNLVFVNNNKLDKEKEYIGYNINYTKQAYNIKTDEIEYENSESITKENLENNSEIINNIRLVDDETTLKNLNSLQTNSGYYTYRNTKLQKYIIDGQEKIVYVSPREIDSSSDTSTYNNRTYRYTHGFGSIISYANKVDETGNVEYVQKDFTSNNEVINISEPRIYYGTQTNSTVVTKSTGISEFDYPVNSTTINETTYNGKSGIKVGFFDRLILSIMNKNVNITFSSINSDSKILLNRNITDRAKKIMPYLVYDENPYLIITSSGKQVWVLDAYTVSNEYPYSQKTNIKIGDFNGQINYIRNSVKVLIDAYDGTVDFYITDTTDPIAVAYSHAYPKIFKDKSSIAIDISEHFVYPQALYKVQAEMLKIYHNVTEDVLYRGDDTWDFAYYNSTLKTSSKIKIDEYYTMVKDDGENKIGLVVPYTVYGKQNITSYLVGTVGKTGKLVLKIYRYSPGSNILGPEQLDKEIQQDEAISKEIESVNVTGTKISKNIVIVPINNSLLYIEPIYQQQLNEKNSMPLLKKVVVASGSKVAIGNTLNEALDNLVSQSAVNITVENTDTLQDIINSIIDANNNLKDSTKSQNFEMIGKDITKIQELIEKLEKQNTSKENEIIE